jgi:nucleotide-binding universal stress UspA family protein
MRPYDRIRPYEGSLILIQTVGHGTIAYRTILVPLDGSERAEAALPHAVALARQFGALLLLFRAVESATVLPPAVPAPGLPRPPPPLLDTVQLAEQARDAAGQYLLP